MSEEKPDESGAPRSYRSPKREEQARRNRVAVLEAFTELLAEKRADEITVREIAAAAGVSQPTVYRYFPDRIALLEGLDRRVDELMGQGPPRPTSLDDLGRNQEHMFVMTERFPIEIRAAVLLNADPRRYASNTSSATTHLQQLLDDELADLDDRARQQLGGLVRCLGASHTWLRLREEWGIDGHESGPLIRWAIETLIEAARDGGLPVEPKTEDDL